MRKILISLAIVIALLYFGKLNLAKFNDELQGEYVVYSCEKVGEQSFGVDGDIVYCGGIDDLLKIEHIEGETIVLNGDMADVKTILKKLFVVYHKSETIDGIYIIDGYSPRLKRTIFVNGIMQNVQITIKNNIITISNPINLGSF